MKVRTQELGRLAMRIEGDYWVAYYAMADTMEEAIELGRIALVAVDPEHRRLAFMHMMQDVVGDIFEKQIGARPTWPTTRPAPKHERRR